MCSRGSVNGAVGMKVRTLIDRASFGTKTVKVMGQAFDETWARIAPIVRSFPGGVELARIRLAEAILSVTTAANMDVAALKADALYVMAKHYSSHFRRE